MLGKICTEYCTKSSLHGLRFIAAPDKHWTERCLWTICCILSWIGSVMLIRSAYDNFRNNSLSFSADTTYLDWNTDFISIVVCEEFKPLHVAKYVKENMKDIKQRNLNTVVDAVAQIAFFRGEQDCIKECYKGHIATGMLFDPTKQCPFENFTSIITGVRSKCQEIFHRCLWNDQEFDCCKYFLPLHGELGMCYAINNLHSEDYKTQKDYMELKSNRSLGPGKMFLNFSSSNTRMKKKREVVMELEDETAEEEYDYEDEEEEEKGKEMGQEEEGTKKVYLLAKDEVPTLNTPLVQQIVIGSTPMHHTVEFVVTEVMNLPGVQNIDMEQRRCKFPDENLGLIIFKQYSFSACLVECRMNKSLEFCNCTNPLLPISDATSCNLDGLICYASNPNIKTLKNEWNADSSGIVCNCMQGCNELNLGVIRSEKEPSHFSTTVLVKMNHLPTIRYKRQVVREKLDLVVSMGGTAGLFLGASLLSLVEFFHHFIIRPILEIIQNHVRKKHNMPSKLHVSPIYSNRLPVQV